MVSHFGRPNRRERREEEKREEEEEKEKKKRREEEGRSKRTLSMDSSTDHMDFAWNCMDHMDFLYRYMFVGCKKPNPRINSYGIKSMESFL